MARTIFFTGLPCSGKTTLAKAIYKRLKYPGGEDTLFSSPTIHLDGDVLRKGLCADLGFSDEDRTENLRRVAYMAQLLNKNGIRAVCSFIAPLQKQRDMITEIIGDVFWVWTYCPVSVCEERDVKGMWAKARTGEITGFTGLDAPYQEPGCLKIDTSIWTVDECVEKVMEALCKSSS